MDFSNFLLLLISDLILLSSENILCIIPILINVLRLILCPSIHSVLKNVPHVLEKKCTFYFSLVEIYRFHLGQVG